MFIFIKNIVFAIILTTILTVPFIATNVEAASVDVAQSVLQGVGNKIFGVGESDIVVVVGRVIQAILGLIGVVFTALIIYGGIMYMTAAGNQEQVGKARTLIRDSVIGLAIIILSFAITEFVITNLFDSVT
jgi:hypothetical protein